MHSNIYNHPKKIGLPKRDKILLSHKTGMPIAISTPEGQRTELKIMKTKSKMNQQDPANVKEEEEEDNENTSDEEDQNSDTADDRPRVDTSKGRSKEESKEEKKARKAMIKEERRVTFFLLSRT